MDLPKIIWSLLRTLMVLFPTFLNVDEEYFELDLLEDDMNVNVHVQEDEHNRDEGGGHNDQVDAVNVRDWFEQEVDSEVKWCLALNSVEFRAASEFQNLTVLSTKRFGKGIANLIREHMTANHKAFNDLRLRIVYNDAKYQLEKSEEKFDVILGDLPDPDESGHNHLYTKSFYKNVVKPKLKDNGLFVTQAGPAGILTHKAVFSPIYNTLKQVFIYVVAYTALVPSYGDLYGWIMASNEPINLDAEQLNNTIGERIRGELRYLDGPVIAASTVLNKTLKNSLMEETRIITEENVTVGVVRKRGVRNYALVSEI
ncbi:Thermospermine synthase ACAULIS5 [Spatholobus suberectus]|nr:Thermospermine synthase ACAULIS5 [Spatholobus suberectus]